MFTLPELPLRQPTTAGALADRLVGVVTAKLDELVDAHAPGVELPAMFAGHAVLDDARCDLIYTLGLLHELGVSDVGGRSIADHVPSELPSSTKRTSNSGTSDPTAATSDARGPMFSSSL